MSSMRRISSISPKIAPSEITPPERYLSRRTVLAAGARPRCHCNSPVAWAARHLPQAPAALAALTFTRNAAFSTTEAPNSYRDISTYNNYYEFGTDKSDPAENAQHSAHAAVECRGLRRSRSDRIVLHRGHLEAASARRAHLSIALRGGLVDGGAVDRISARRPAQALQAHVEGKVRRIQDPVRPETNARTTLRGARMALRRGAAHRRGDASARDHGRGSVRQGAAQSERRANAARSCPGNTGSRASSRSSASSSPTECRAPPGRGSAPSEYGFFANVNPAVDHPRWSQASERHIGSGSLFGSRRPTLPFNGYADAGGEPLQRHGSAEILLNWQIRWILKPLVFVACLLPAVRLLAGAFGCRRRFLGRGPGRHAAAHLRQDGP